MQYKIVYTDLEGIDQTIYQTGTSEDSVRRLFNTTYNHKGIISVVEHPADGIVTVPSNGDFEKIQEVGKLLHERSRVNPITQRSAELVVSRKDEFDEDAKSRLCLQHAECILAGTASKAMIDKFNSMRNFIALQLM